MQLSQLITEVETEFRQIGLETGAIDRLDAVIHEWYESALANSSPELAFAFNDEVDEVMLLSPLLSPLSSQERGLGGEVKATKDTV